MKIIKLFLVGILMFSCLIAYSQTNIKANVKKNYKLSFEKNFNVSEMEKISMKIDNIYQEWKSKLKIKPRTKVEFKFYKSEKSYKSKSGVILNQNVYLNNNIVHISPKAIEDDKYLVQAILLGLLNEANNNGCPKWLSEGFSVYATLSEEVKNQNFVGTQQSLKDFQQEFGQLKKETQYKAFLVKTFSFLNYLEKKYGREKLYLLFKNYNRKKTEDEVFLSAFGVKLEEIEKGWNSYIGSMK